MKLEISNYLQKLLEKRQISKLKNNPSIFGRIQNPSEKVILEAIKLDPENLLEISRKDLTGNIKKYIVESNNKTLLRNLETITLNPGQKLSKVKKGFELRLEPNSSESFLRRELDKNTPLILAEFEDIIPEHIKLEYVMKDTENLKHLRKPSEEIQRKAVLKNPSVFNLINKDFMSNEIKQNLLSYISSYNKRNNDSLIYDVEEKSVLSNDGFDIKFESKRDIEELVEISEYDNQEERFESYKQSEEINSQILFKNINDRKTVIDVMKRDGSLYSMLNNNMKNDVEVAFEAVKSDSMSFKKVPDLLKSQYGYQVDEFFSNAKKEILKRDIRFNDIKEGFELLRNNEVSAVDLLKYGSDNIKDNEDLVKECINKDYQSYKYCSDRVKNNSRIINNVLSKDGYMLKYIPEDKKSIREVVMIAVKENPDSFELAHKNILSSYNNVDDFKEDKLKTMVKPRRTAKEALEKIKSVKTSSDTEKDKKELNSSSHTRR